MSISSGSWGGGIVTRSMWRCDEIYWVVVRVEQKILFSQTLISILILQPVMCLHDFTSLRVDSGSFMYSSLALGIIPVEHR
jgi:hypothetical protein